MAWYAWRTLTAAISVTAAFCVGAAAGVGAVWGFSPCRQPFAMLICGAEYAFAVLRFGVTPHCLNMCILFRLLLRAAVSDLETTEIPDDIHLGAAGCFMAFLPFEPHMPFILARGILGAIVIGLAMLFLSWLAEAITGRESLGGGDIKLFSVLGLYFGPVGGDFLVTVSCAVGLVFCALNGIEKGTAFPFVPSIAVGAFITAMADTAPAAFFGL